jgi:hypothetical protein
MMDSKYNDGKSIGTCQEGTSHLQDKSIDAHEFARTMKKNCPCSHAFRQKVDGLKGTITGAFGSVVGATGLEPVTPAV